MEIFLKTVIPVIAPHKLQLVILQFQCFLVNGILIFLRYINSYDIPYDYF